MTRRVYHLFGRDVTGKEIFDTLSADEKDQTKSETTPPFKKFEGLLKALLSVPKKEVDKKLAEHEREKERKKREDGS